MHIDLTTDPTAAAVRPRPWLRELSGSLHRDGQGLWILWTARRPDWSLLETSTATAVFYWHY